MMRLVSFRLVCLGAMRRPQARLPAMSATSQSSANRRQDVPAASTTPFHEYSVVTKLFVGNLPFTATDETVSALFSQHGTVEKVSLITDRETGRPRGFGFVEMANDDASRAMQALNGADFDGRSLKVNEAQERERSGGGGTRHGGARRY